MGHHEVVQKKRVGLGLGLWVQARIARHHKILHKKRGRVGARVSRTDNEISCFLCKKG